AIQYLRDHPLVKPVELTTKQKAEQKATEILLERSKKVEAPVVEAEKAAPATPSLPFGEYVKQVAAVAGPSGERARRFMGYARKIQGGKATDIEKAAYQKLGKELQAGHAKLPP